VGLVAPAVGRTVSGTVGIFARVVVVAAVVVPVATVVLGRLSAVLDPFGGVPEHLAKKVLE